jgi:hypothetical protein
LDLYAEEIARDRNLFETRAAQFPQNTESNKITERVLRDAEEIERALRAGEQPVFEEYQDLNSPSAWGVMKETGKSALTELYNWLRVDKVKTKIKNSLISRGVTSDVSNLEGDRVLAAHDSAEAHNQQSLPFHSQVLSKLSYVNLKVPSHTSTVSQPQILQTLSPSPILPESEVSQFPTSRKVRVYYSELFTRNSQNSRIDE